MVENTGSIGNPANQTYNQTIFWAAELFHKTGQGFTIAVDAHPRWISGCQMKNKEEGTKEFRLSGSLNKNGPFHILLQEKLEDTKPRWSNRNKPAPLLNFNFEEPVKIKFLKFDLLDIWGNNGGLGYFAAIPCEYRENKH